MIQTPLFTASTTHDQRRVIVRPLANYGFTKHVRVSIGLEEENDKFLAAAKKVLGK